MSSAAGEIARPLREPGVFETLGASVALMREHPLQLMLPFGIVQLFIVAERLLVMTQTASEDEPAIGWDLLWGTGEALLTTLGMAAVVVASAGLARAQSASTGVAFTQVFQRLLPLLALFLLLSLILVLTIVPGCVTGGIAAAAGADDWLVITLSTVIGLPLVVYVMTRVALAYQAFLLDGEGPVQAISESWSLTGDNVMRLFAIILVAAVAAIAVQVGIGVLLGFAGDTARTIGGGLIGIPLTVFGFVALTLYSLRIRETSPVRERVPDPEPSAGRGW